MNSTHLHRGNSHTSVFSWKRSATLVGRRLQRGSAAIATAALGIIPATAPAPTANSRRHP